MVERSGPGVLEESREDVKVVTPFNIGKFSARVPQNCCCVPYLGFPLSFISVRRLSNLFMLLDAAKSQEQWTSLFRTIFAIRAVVGGFANTRVEIVNSIS
jgi:hypothetical protein